MKSIHIFLLFVLGTAVLPLGIRGNGRVTPHQSPGTAVSGPQGAVEFLGAGSCSASACHNSGFARRSERGEYNFWVVRDPHAKAYEVLFDQSSGTMQKKLGRSIPAHEDQRCLSCHVAPEYREDQPPRRAPHFKSDGVSCESCHGPASQWIGEHHLNSWRGRSSADKKRLGMNDTRSLLGRAQVCAACHVGAPGMEVDHDLIAAGHPRLHFELAAFHAHMPRHWPDAKDRAGCADFETQLWASGQLATAQAGLELLAERARGKAWPEFAEFDCASCHHNLTSPSDRQQIGPGKQRPGALAWGPLAFSAMVTKRLFPGQAALHEALDALRRNLDVDALRGRGVGGSAADAARLLRPAFEGAAPRRFDVNKALIDFLTRPGFSGDQALQRYLALTAISAREPALSPRKLGIRLTIPAYEPRTIGRLSKELP